MDPDLAVLTQLSTWVVVGAVVVVVAGAMVQSVFGFGLGVIAAPFLLWAAPGLMPEALLVATLGLPLFTLRSEWRAVDVGGLGWALAGRVPGMLLGAVVLVVADKRVLSVLVAASVLVSVAISFVSMQRRVAITRTPRRLLVAGSVSGFTGTTVAVGGPPLALLYQDQGGARVRATMASYFLVGVLLSLATISVFGQLAPGAVAAGAVCVPLVGLGHLATVRVRSRTGDRRIRVGILALCALSAVLLALDALRAG